MLPQAEINTAGVIIAVSTATAEDVGSTSNLELAEDDFCVADPLVFAKSPQKNVGLRFSVDVSFCVFSQAVWLQLKRQ
jgi:hypothetical protein